jgi:hypothetical protein
MILLPLLAAAAFDLAPSRVTADQVKKCRVDETLPLGRGTLEKLSCGPSLDLEAARKRCKEGSRRNSLPAGVTADNCQDEYSRGHFLFRGETKELVIARRKDGKPVVVFKIMEGDQLSVLQHFGSAALIGVGGGKRLHYAVVTTAGALKAPDLGDPEEIRDVSIVGGRIRIRGRARAMYIDLVPGPNGQLIRK